MELVDRGIVVTGAGRGLGAALAQEFAARGAHPVLVARGEADLDAIVGQIHAKGGKASAIVADVANKEDTYRISALARELAGPIDLVVHNASTLGRWGEPGGPGGMPFLADTACEDLAQVLETNLIGPFRLTKALLGPMVARGRGLVVGLSSDAATSAYAGWGAYGLSKAALDHLLRTFAAELEGTGVDFVCFDPGEMDTRMHHAAIPDADPATLRRPADVARAIADRIAKGPFGGARFVVEAEEVRP